MNFSFFSFLIICLTACSNPLEPNPNFIAENLVNYWTDDDAPIVHYLVEFGTR